MCFSLDNSQLRENIQEVSQGRVAGILDLVDDLPQQSTFKYSVVCDTIKMFLAHHHDDVDKKCTFYLLCSIVLKTEPIRNLEVAGVEAGFDVLLTAPSLRRFLQLESTTSHDSGLYSFAYPDQDPSKITPEKMQAYQNFFRIFHSYRDQYKTSGPNDPVIAKIIGALGSVQKERSLSAALCDQSIYYLVHAIHYSLTNSKSWTYLSQLIYIFTQIIIIRMTNATRKDSYRSIKENERRKLSNYFIGFFNLQIESSDQDREIAVRLNRLCDSIIEDPSQADCDRLFDEVVDIHRLTAAEEVSERAEFESEVSKRAYCKSLVHRLFNFDRAMLSAHQEGSSTLFFRQTDGSLSTKRLASAKKETPR